jgi:ABC-type branched-subunit amino acid transport system ATPase component
MKTPGSGAAATLRITGLGVRFRGVQALDDVDLNLTSGRVCAVVGPNGSGKTTLLNAISGFVRIHSGQIWVGDLALHKTAAFRRKAAGIGRAFQVPPIMPGWTVTQYLDTANYSWRAPSWYRSVLRPGRTQREAEMARAEAYAELEHVGVHAAADALVGEISLGELKLIDVVRARIGATRLVLLDEPTSGLGLGEVSDLQDFIRTTADTGLTVIVVEHNLEFVAEIADVVVVLDQGRVVACGSPAEVFADPAVRNAYMGGFARHGRLADDESQRRSDTGRASDVSDSSATPRTSSS